MATKFTVYKLKSSQESFVYRCLGIVDDHNSGLDNNEYHFKRIEPSDFRFENIGENYLVFISKYRTNPTWVDSIQSLVNENIHDIGNVNYSFVVFLQYGQSIYAVTGGLGHNVISQEIDYYFGLDVLSRLMDTSDDIIKATSNRSLSGNVFSGHQQFINHVNLVSEREVTHFFKEINTSLTREKIKDQFEIDIKEKRKEFNFLAKDAIKLGKSITLKELDLLIKNLERLIEKEEALTQINRFHEVNSRDPVHKELNDRLNDIFISCIEGQMNIEDVPLSVLPSEQNYSNCDKYILRKYGTKTKAIEHDTPIAFYNLVDFFFLYYYGDAKSNQNNVENFLKEVRIQGYIDDELIFSPKIFEILSMQLTMGNKYYFLLDGKWFYLNNDFINNVNNQFVYQIANLYENSKRISYMKSWPPNSEEKYYNHSHNEVDNIFVLDRMLIENIEMCDLLSIKDNEPRFIHVKDGLAGDTRILCAQILSAMDSLHSALFGNDSDFLSDYYRSIENKCRAKDEYLKTSAEKFINQFNEEQLFIDYIFNNFNNITFVLAFKGEQHDLYRPEKTISSAPAKISLLDLVQKSKQYNFKLEIFKIDES